ncbi:MAG: FkbM family methyltransferase, partial [Acidimicrobiia bacterium]
GFRTSKDRSMTDLQMLIGTYERETQLAVRDLLRPGDIVVDVGAHIGFFTKLFSKAVGDSGLIYALEPHPTTFQTLVHNCRKQRNVRFLQAAASAISGEVEFYESDTSTGSNSLIPTRSVHHRQFRVPAVALDDILRGTKVRLVKIDVEGAELEVLSGMRDLIAHADSLTLIVEFFPPVWESRGFAADHLIDTLEESQFHLCYIRSDGKLEKIPPYPDRKDFLQRIEKYVNLVATRVR